MRATLILDYHPSTQSLDLRCSAQLRIAIRCAGLICVVWLSFPICRRSLDRHKIKNLNSS